MAFEAPAIVPLETVDEERVLALVRTGLGTGSTPRSPELWRWKHRDSPFGPSPGLAAVAGEEVVALRVFSRWRFASANGEHAAVRAVDTATHPDWRRRGLFRRLTAQLVDELTREGVPFVFNTPNRVSFRGYRELGWGSAGRVSLAIKPLNPKALLTSRTASGGSTKSAIGRSVEDLLAVPTLDDFLASLWQDERRLHTVRDRTYLEWRYFRVPGIDYRATWELSGSSGAVVIVRPRLRRGRSEVALAEVLTGPGEASVALAVSLLERLRTDASAAGASYLVAVPPRRAEEGTVLRRTGFFRVPWIGPRLAIRRLAATPQLPAPLVTRHWRLSLGDLELF